MHGAGTRRGGVLPSLAQGRKGSSGGKLSTMGMGGISLKSISLSNILKAVDQGLDTRRHCHEQTHTSTSTPATASTTPDCDGLHHDGHGALASVQGAEPAAYTHPQGEPSAGSGPGSGRHETTRDDWGSSAAGRGPSQGQAAPHSGGSAKPARQGLGDHPAAGPGGPPAQPDHPPDWPERDSNALNPAAAAGGGEAPQAALSRTLSSRSDAASSLAAGASDGDSRPRRRLMHCDDDGLCNPQSWPRIAFARSS